MDPDSYDFTNNFGKNVFVSGVLTQQGSTVKYVLHGIVGCLATSIAKEPESWKHSIMQHRCYNKYCYVFR